MKKYTIIGGVMTLAIVFTLTLAASTYASFSGGENGQGLRFGMTEETKALQEKIAKAIESGDYETWKSLVSQMPNADKRAENMSEDDFQKIVEMYANRKDMRETHTVIQEAVENGDYESWAKLVSDSQMPNKDELLDVVNNEAVFSQMADAHQLIKEGQAMVEEGKDKLQELGLPQHAGQFQMNKGFIGFGKSNMKRPFQGSMNGGRKDLGNK
ncbi:hypothetical protein JW758_01635 [Candidatus Peregrinibacteria bacterium]|nr:hypothetical protein [Candidatus Peregrinibacteria bacterium]